jgi:hypothetical protein
MPADQFDGTEINVNPHSFVKGVLRFPCFRDAQSHKDYSALFELIFEAYRQDQLTEEQDLVIELILHLHEETTPFNLKRAREIWSPEDMSAFIQLITTA